MTAPTLAEALDVAWRRLPHDLGRERIDAAFNPRLPAAAIDQLLNSARLERRLADRIANHLGLVRPAEDDFHDPGARIVFAGQAAVAKAMRLAGAIRHRERIRPLVLRHVRAEISAGIGEDAFAAAQSCPVAGPPPTNQWTAAELVQACLRDGPSCVACWVRVLPPGIGGWIAALVPSLSDFSVPDYPDRDSVSAGSLAAAAVLAQIHG